MKLQDYTTFYDNIKKIELFCIYCVSTKYFLVNMTHFQNCISSNYELTNTEKLIERVSNSEETDTEGSSLDNELEMLEELNAFFSTAIGNHDSSSDSCDTSDSEDEQNFNEIKSFWNEQHKKIKSFNHQGGNIFIKFNTWYFLGKK